MGSIIKFHILIGILITFDSKLCFILRKKVDEMKKFKHRNILLDQRGMTLIEIIVSLAILAIIIVPFLTMFLQSTVSTKKSEDILDATYVAQYVMEGIYNDSKDGNIDITPDGWDPLGRKHWVCRKISDQSINPVNVLVWVYSDESKLKLEVQMETKLLLK